MRPGNYLPALLKAKNGCSAIAKVPELKDTANRFIFIVVASGAGPILRPA